MSSDRELLEAAARAAGREPADHVAMNGSWVYFEPHKRTWNPLADDGDALRLAAKLRLGIDYEDCACCVTIYGVTDEDGEHIKERISFVGQEVTAVDEATRRAIVRAAAAMANR